MKRGCKISPTTPVAPSRLDVALDVVQVVAAAEAECDVVVHDVIFRAPTLLTPLRLYHPVPRHRLSAVAMRPVGLLAQDSRIGHAPLLTDILPLRPVIKAHAMTTLTVGALLVSKIAMVHSNLLSGHPFS